MCHAHPDGQTMVKGYTPMMKMIPTATSATRRGESLSLASMRVPPGFSIISDTNTDPKWLHLTPNRDVASSPSSRCSVRESWFVCIPRKVIKHGAHAASRRPDPCQSGRVFAVTPSCDLGHCNLAGLLVEMPKWGAAMITVTSTNGGTAGALQTAVLRSLQDPEAFWAEAAAAIHWYKKCDKVLDDSRAPFYRWFSGGELNTCYNALDLHVETGRANQAALIYDSPVTNQVKTFTYSELRHVVARFAGVLVQQGVVKGDRVVIYMPMVPEA